MVWCRPTQPRIRPPRRRLPYRRCAASPSAAGSTGRCSLSTTGAPRARIGYGVVGPRSRRRPVRMFARPRAAPYRRTEPSLPSAPLCPALVMEPPSSRGSYAGAIGLPLTASRATGRVAGPLPIRSRPESRYAEVAAARSLCRLFRTVSIDVSAANPSRTAERRPPTLPCSSGPGAPLARDRSTSHGLTHLASEDIARPCPVGSPPAVLHRGTALGARANGPEHQVFRTTIAVPPHTDCSAPHVRTFRRAVLAAAPPPRWDGATSSNPTRCTPPSPRLDISPRNRSAGLRRDKETRPSPETGTDPRLSAGSSGVDLERGDVTRGVPHDH